MKDRIEKKLFRIYEMHKTNDETGEDQLFYVFSGDEKETAHNVSIDVLMNYFEWLEEEKERALDVFEKKIKDKDFDPKEAMDVIQRFDKVIKRLDEKSWKDIGKGFPGPSHQTEGWR